MMTKLIKSGEEVIFRYLVDTTDFEEAKKNGFECYPAFRKPKQTYRGDVLSIFMLRPPPRKRADFAEYLMALRMPSELNISDFALLGYSEGRLPRLVGPGRAAEMLLTGKTITAAEAFQMGLVNWVVKPEKLIERALDLLDEVSSKAPHAVHLTWDIVRQTGCMTKGDALMLGTEYFGRVSDTEDFHEGTTAFMQKRKPDFKGR